MAASGDFHFDFNFVKMVTKVSIIFSGLTFSEFDPNSKKLFFPKSLRKGPLLQVNAFLKVLASFIFNSLKVQE